jgi:ubiquinol-cytochrome c reductase iron-sulfur subunit
VNKERRVWMIACGAAGGVAALGGGTALLQTLAPSESAKLQAQPVEVDVSNMQPGEAQLLAWQGKPVWVVRRSPEMLQTLSALAPQLADPLSLRHADALTPVYARNIHRSIKPEYLVAMGVCSHLGCSPLARLQAGPQARLPDDWKGGFLCPCHGSTFDVAGRVFANKPAPDNLAVPPHRYLSDTRILIGEAEPDASHS